MTKSNEAGWAAAGRAALMAALLAAATAPASATPVVLNGGFETLTPASTPSTEFGTRFGGQVVSNWTTGGYNFLFTPGTADSTGAANEFGGALTLWGPNNTTATGPMTGPANGLPAASPAGGNFIAADGAFNTDGINQTITGLSAHSTERVTFYWAGAQQQGFNGPTTEQWQVSLGNQVDTTAAVSNVNHGFTGWQQTTLTFVATSASEVLSFLAIGTPNGVPPFSLLDGVSITEVPEPTSMALLGAGLTVAGLVSRRRTRRAA